MGIITVSFFFQCFCYLRIVLGEEGCCKGTLSKYHPFRAGQLFDIPSYVWILMDIVYIVSYCIVFMHNCKCKRSNLSEIRTTHEASTRLPMVCFLSRLEMWTLLVEGRATASLSRSLLWCIQTRLSEMSVLILFRYFRFQRSRCHRMSQSIMSESIHYVGLSWFFVCFRQLLRDKESYLQVPLGTAWLHWGVLTDFRNRSWHCPPEVRPKW